MTATHRLLVILAADAVGYSRLMSIDDAGTLAALEAARDVFRSACTPFGGRVVDTAGDSVLVVFESATGAVEAAQKVQCELAEQNAPRAEDRRLHFRIGVHLGDVILQPDGSVYGDGVNVAARLQALAQPGGSLVSESVRAAVRPELASVLHAVGEYQLKNIEQPVRAYRLCESNAQRAEGTTSARAAPLEQEIRFSVTADGVRIASAATGAGVALVKPGHWTSHLECDLDEPDTAAQIAAISEFARMIRYDPRGCGLSGRRVQKIDRQGLLEDLDAVVKTWGLERFSLLGGSAAAALSVAYAALHPDRVEKLILFNGFATSYFSTPNLPPEKKDEAEMILRSTRHGWADSKSPFHQVFIAQTVGASSTPSMREQVSTRMQRSMTPEMAEAYLRNNYGVDVVQLCAKVKCPTLVFHCRGDALVRADQGRKLASLIPGARFVLLEADGHLITHATASKLRLYERVREFLVS
jgi:class 3 adenylate cyclase/pimeloyl-ACP methyl ester carboxylesterase